MLARHRRLVGLIRAAYFLQPSRSSLLEMAQAVAETTGDLRAALEEARDAAELAPEDPIPAGLAAQLERAVAGR